MEQPAFDQPWKLTFVLNGITDIPMMCKDFSYFIYQLSWQCILLFRSEGIHLFLQSSDIRDSVQ